MRRPDAEAGRAAIVQDALERLSRGQYGRCQACDGFIGAARLRALPFAQLCRDCQDQAEGRARRELAAAARELRRSASGDHAQGSTPKR